jgi:hypothetical protein
MPLFHRIQHMRCRRFLDASVDGELTGGRARRIRTHLSACPRCARDEDLTIIVKQRLWLFGLWQPRVVRRRPDEL